MSTRRIGRGWHTGPWLTAGLLLVSVGIGASSTVTVELVERPLYTEAGHQREPRISGDRVVFTDLATMYGDIYVGDVNSGGFWNLTATPDRNEQLNDVDGDLVVYTDRSGGGGGDIVVVDANLPAGSPPVALIAGPAEESRPRIGGDFIVYEVFNGTDFDIQVYELSTGSIFTAAGGAGNQLDPSISNGRVVYHEYEAGEVWLYDIGTDASLRIDAGQYPDIDGDHVVYAKDVGGGDYDVFLAVIGSGEAPVDISARPGEQRNPSIVGNFVAYDDSSAGNWDVYLYLISEGLTVQVTSNTEDQKLQDVGIGHIVFEDYRNLDTTGVDIYVSDFSIAVEPPPPPPCADEVLAFVAQGRIGDVLVQHGQDAFEVAVGDKVGGQFEAGETADYYWENGLAVPFVLSYDAEAGAVDFVLGGVAVSHTVVADADSMTQVGVRVRASHKWTSVLMSDLVFDDTPLSNEVEASGEAGRTAAELLLGLDTPGQSFVLEGKATLGWDEGDRPLPQNSQLSFQIGVGTYACEDDAPAGCNATHTTSGAAGLLLLLLALLGLGLRRVTVPVEKRRRR